MSWFSSGLKSVVGEQRFEDLRKIFTAGITERITGLKVVQPYIQQAQANRIQDLREQYTPFIIMGLGVVLFYFLIKKL